jgi:hypothetical protein
LRLQETTGLLGGNGTVARALFGELMKHGRRVFKKERAM